MTEENIHNEQQPIPLDKALKDFRLAENLTVDEIADRLNLKASVISNLENNLEKVISDGIYPLIYLRGYLINYSKELKFPKIESYVEFQQLSHPSESITTLQNTYVFNDKQRLSKKILLITLLITIAVIVGIFYFDKTSTNIKTEAGIELNKKEIEKDDALILTPVFSENVEELTEKTFNIDSVDEVENYAVTSEVKSKPSRPHAEKIENNLAVDEAIAKEEVVIAKVIVTTPDIKSPVTSVLNVQPAIADIAQDNFEDRITEENIIEESTLKLLFEEESWAVVTDAKNERLAFGLYQTGKELDLVGTAPFSLKLGNPPAVVIYYQDQLIENNFERGKIAKFSLPE